MEKKLQLKSHKEVRLLSFYTIGSNENKTMLELKETKRGYLNGKLIHIFNFSPQAEYQTIGMIKMVEKIRITDAYKTKVNIAIYFNSPTINYDIIPIYVKLNLLSRLTILFRYKKLWIQQNWFYTMSISILALAATFSNVYLNIKNKEEQIMNSKIEVIHELIDKNNENLKQMNEDFLSLKNGMAKSEKR
jgi:hypothetical protein